MLMPASQVEWEEVLEKDPDDICMVWVGVQEAKMNQKLLRSGKVPINLKRFNKTVFMFLKNTCIVALLQDYWKG